MNNPSSNLYGGYQDSYREPGARRKKLAGYLRAANELRQTYTQQYFPSGLSKETGSDEQVPGAFPQSSSERRGDEELVIFPSYARRHAKHSKKRQPDKANFTRASDSTKGVEGRDENNSASGWSDEWRKYEDSHALVDVDVRGWLYTPQTGPMSRKQRMLIGMARQLVGIPAPARSPGDSTTSSRTSSPSGLRARVDAHHARKDDEIAAKEATTLMQVGESEAEAAQEGLYSEGNSSGRGRSGQSPSTAGLDDQDTYENEGSTRFSDQSVKSKKSKTFKAIAQMTPDELATANEHLLTRLRPFLAVPSIGIPISAFFYNDQDSRQFTVDTDASGHFSLRAALEFIPTHVRVLASENLSATQNVTITDPQGVSIISDIDDTVKHSAITAGAREIFRNVFIRELGDLSVEGVKEWYSQLASKGCFMHYVSNSPWQMFPVLKTYFGLAGLPAGAFHLKQYSGMFQGIFEPVAERKKASLEKIFRDFSERKYILVGDSGEADLEVYTDVVLENPGRILGIFIRDVTTPQDDDQPFDSKWGPLTEYQQRKRQRHGGRPVAPSARSREQRKPPEGRERNPEEDEEAALSEAIRRSLIDEDRRRQRPDESDAVEQRPKLPPRASQQEKPQEKNLIDFSSSDEEGGPLPSTPPKHEESPNPTARQEKPRAPPRPVKPAQLASIATRKESEPNTAAREGGPPLPPRRPRPTPSQDQQSQRQDSDTTDSSELSYSAMAKARIASAYNRLPSPVAYWNGPQDSQSDTQRNGATSRPQSATSLQALYNEYPDFSSESFSSTTNPPIASYSEYYDGDPNPVDKKLELWKRRWARAMETLEGKGVLLRAWRTGYDAVEDSMKLIDDAGRQNRQPK